MIRRLLFKWIMGLVLLLIGTHLFFGRYIVDLSISYYAKRNGLSITYTLADAKVFSGRFKLLDVSIKRALPHFLDIQTSELSGTIQLQSLLHGQYIFKIIDLFDVEGRIIENDLSIPFQFNSLTFRNLNATDLLHTLLFQTTVQGSVWEGHIKISSDSLNINTIPVAYINQLFGNPLPFFKTGLVGIKTVTPWVDENGDKVSQLALSVHSFDAQIPPQLGGLERLLASQVIVLLQTKDQLEIQVPVRLTPDSFTGDISKDLSEIFRDIGLHLVTDIPKQLAHENSSHYYSKNAFNLSDAQIAAIQKSLKNALTK